MPPRGLDRQTNFTYLFTKRTTSTCPARTLLLWRARRLKLGRLSLQLLIRIAPRLPPFLPTTTTKSGAFLRMSWIYVFDRRRHFVPYRLVSVAFRQILLLWERVGPLCSGDGRRRAAAFESCGKQQLICFGIDLGSGGHAPELPLWAQHRAPGPKRSSTRGALCLGWHLPAARAGAQWYRQPRWIQLQAAPAQAQGSSRAGCACQ